MNSWFSSAWDDAQQQAADDERHRQEEAKAQQNAGDVPVAAGQGPFMGTPAPAPTGINPTQGGFRDPVSNPPNVTPGPNADPFGPLGNFAQDTLLPAFQQTQVGAGPAGGQLAGIPQSTTYGQASQAEIPYAQQVQGYAGDVGQAVGDPVGLGGPGRWLAEQTVPTNVGDAAISIPLNFVGAGGPIEALTGLPLDNLARAGVSGARDIFRAGMPEPSLYPGLGAGLPPIHPGGGEMAFGPGVHGGGLPVPPPTQDLDAALRASLEARGVTPPPADLAPAFPEPYPTATGTMGHEFPWARDMRDARGGGVREVPIDPNSPAARMGAPESYNPAYMPPTPEAQAADTAMQNLGVAPVDNLARPDMAQELSARMEGQVARVAVNPEAVTPLDPNSLMGSRGAVELTNPQGARILGPDEMPGPGEVLMHHGTGDAGLQGDLRPGTNLTPNIEDAQNFARTTSRIEDVITNTPGLTDAQKDFLRSPNGQAAAAQRDAALNAGVRPSETGAAGGGRLPPEGVSGTAGVPPPSRGVNPSLWREGMSAIAAPTRILLGFFPHSLRIGVQEIPTHPGAFVNALKGMAEIYRTGKADVANALTHSYTGNIPYGAHLADMEAKFHPPATQYVNPTLAEKGLKLIPGLDRTSRANFGYLNLFRDGIYNQAADFLARTTPGADLKMYEDLYLRASHGTGHSTLPGLRGNSTLGAAGLGPSALAARLQNTLDVFTKSGAPTPFSAGARGEAIRSLMGVAGVMAATSAVGYQLGGEVNLPFDLGPIKATDLTNQNGIDSKLFKVVSTTPDLANKTVYGGGAGYDTLFRLFANVGIDAMNGDHKALEGHVTSFFRGQAGVVPAIGLDLLLGSNWRGDPYGPRGGDKGMENFKGDLGQGFINRWGPIAVKSLVDAYKAWGPEGLARAAPSLGAYEVQTSPTTTNEQRNAVKDDPRLPEAIRGVDPKQLGPDGKAALDAVLKQEAPAAQEQAKAAQAENANPVFQKYHETVDQANQQADQRKTDLYNLLRDGKISGEQLRQGREIINSAAAAKKDGARNDPAYKDAISKLEQNDVSKALSVYYKIGDQAPHLANGKPDYDWIQQKQADFAKFVEQKNPETAKLLKFEIDTVQPKTNGLDRLYQLAQPTLQKYFGDIKDTSTSLGSVERSNERRANPQDDALLNLLGYEQKTLTPQAAQILQQMRATLPVAQSPAVAAQPAVAAPVGSTAPAPAPAPPPQPLAAPVASGAKLPPVVANDSQQRQNFVGAMSGPAQTYAASTGIPPAVWAAMGASESNWGRAQSIFGIMGKGTAGGQNYDTFEIRPGGVRENTNSQFAAYNNLDDAFRHFTDLTSSGRYAPAWQHLQDTGDWQGFLHGINQAGYATAPNWADSIISLSHTIEKDYPYINGYAGVR